MYTINQRTTSTFFIAILALTAINANAETISGQGKCTYKPVTTKISDTDDNVVQFSETTCSAIGGFIQGASVINPEIANLYLGNGDNSGYYTITNGVDSTVAKWNGKVTTVMKDGHPVTTSKGQWEYVGGTGKYKDIKGKGEFHSYFTSATEYTVDWKGRKD